MVPRPEQEREYEAYVRGRLPRLHRTAYLLCGDTHRAEDIVQAALTAASPSYALAHYDLAVTEVRSGDYAAAQTELQAALALSPSYARARFALATLMLRADRRTEASARCRHTRAWIRS